MPYGATPHFNPMFFGAIIGAIVLACALIYALVRNRRGNRNPRNKAIGEAATREEYRHPASYDPEPYRRGLEPNPDGTAPRGAPRN